MDNSARVPEHSIPLMGAISGGAPLIIENFLFFHADDWLMGIGYPMNGENIAESKEVFKNAFAEAVKKTGAKNFFAAGPFLDFVPQLQKNIVETDQYYVLSANAPIPSKLKNPLHKASKNLDIRESHTFTAAHRKLWGEFLENRKSPMTDRVEELYLKIPQISGTPLENLIFLDACLPSGELAASVFLDLGPQNFISYIIGAHSRKNYVPHATDLLFKVMLQKAKEHNKRFIHLGLGVNDGIRRFKLKWGARPSWPYQMAQWDSGDGVALKEDLSPARAIALALMRSGGSNPRHILEETSSQKPFAMLWQVKKNDKVSWLAGTAHFFCHSFEGSFKKLFRNVDNVVFEGPLHADFMAQVETEGKKAPGHLQPLIELLAPEDIARLEKKLLGKPSPFFAEKMLTRNLDIKQILTESWPWHAFFTLWTAYLERLGWKESVDMEAWRVATAMHRNIIAMEDLEEQLESLGSLPQERVIRFFKDCGSWRRRAFRNEKAYLRGDLEKMMGSSAEFPTRTEHIVGRRDQRFRERMRPYLEQGRAAIFVGSAHLVNLRHMLQEDGFEVRQTPFGIWPKMHLKYRQLARPDQKVNW